MGPPSMEWIIKGYCNGCVGRLSLLKNCQALWGASNQIPATDPPEPMWHGRAECEKWRKEGLCFYCSITNHFVVPCPNPLRNPALLPQAERTLALLHRSSTNLFQLSHQSFTLAVTIYLDHIGQIDRGIEGHLIISTSKFSEDLWIQSLTKGVFSTGSFHPFPAVSMQNLRMYLAALHFPCVKTRNATE